MNNQLNFNRDIFNKWQDIAIEYHLDSIHFCDRQIIEHSHYPKGEQLWVSRLSHAQLELYYYMFLTYEENWMDSPLKKWANEKIKNR